MNKKSKQTQPDGVPCLITTQFRGVYYGYVGAAVLEGQVPQHLVVRGMRHCFKWVSPGAGLYGLALKGPKAGSKIGPSVALAIISGVANIVPCYAEAVEVWEAAKWDN